MRTSTFGGLTVRLTGGADGQGGGDGPLVVLLHGFGAPGSDLLPLGGVLDGPEGTRFAFPEGPLALDPLYDEARAWWLIEPDRLERARLAGRVREALTGVPEGLDEARALVRAMLTELCAALGVGSERVVLGGFSQGAMLSLDVALADPRPLAGLVLFSGTYAAESVWAPRMASRAGLRVFQSHGTEDPLLPYGLATELRDRLLEAGLALSWAPFRGGHELPPEVLEQASAFVRGALGA